MRLVAWKHNNNYFDLLTDPSLLYTPVELNPTGLRSARAWSPGSVTMSFMSCGTYCFTSTRHSAGSTPRAPIALLISAISSTGPTSSEVPESAIACSGAKELLLSAHPPLFQH